MYVSSTFAYCNHSVSVISYGLGQSDHSSLYCVTVMIQFLLLSLASNILFQFDFFSFVCCLFGLKTPHTFSFVDN